jgi:hypothetical protein
LDEPGFEEPLDFPPPVMEEPGSGRAEPSDERGGRRRRKRRGRKRSEGREGRSGERETESADRGDSGAERRPRGGREKGSEGRGQEEKSRYVSNSFEDAEVLLEPEELTAALPADHSESDDDDHDSDDEGRDFKSHKSIPTWSEAIGVIIDANMESRAKNPATGGSSRGRGGWGHRGRGRSGDRR